MTVKQSYFTGGTGLRACAAFPYSISFGQATGLAGMSSPALTVKNGVTILSMSSESLFESNTRHLPDFI
jgi:hypothetical protein